MAWYGLLQKHLSQGNMQKETDTQKMYLLTFTEVA
jgi:hypothetical protein